MIIAQISDPHITLEDGPRSAAHAAALERAVGHLLRLAARPDVVIVTGDCADHGLPEEYARLGELLAPLPMPWFVIPGNHDDRAAMLRRFGAQGSSALDGFVQYVVDGWPVRLLALDTHVPGADHGLLDDARLGWLSDRLEEAPDRSALLFMHHPPFRTGMQVMDAIGLEGADRFAAIVGRHAQVEAVVAGHVHAATQRRFAGTLAMTCSATASQILPDYTQPERLVVRLDPPACLLHVWQSGTGIVSYTSPIGDDDRTVTLHDGTRWI